MSSISSEIRWSATSGSLWCRAPQRRFRSPAPVRERRLICGQRSTRWKSSPSGAGKNSSALAPSHSSTGRCSASGATDTATSATFCPAPSAPPATSRTRRAISRPVRGRSVPVAVRAAVPSARIRHTAHR